MLSRSTRGPAPGRRPHEVSETRQYLRFRARETVRATHLQALLKRLSRLLILTDAREGETEQADRKCERVGVAVTGTCDLVAQERDRPLVVPPADRVAREILQRAESACLVPDCFVLGERLLVVLDRGDRVATPMVPPRSTSA